MAKKTVYCVFKVIYYDIDGKRRVEYEPVFQKSQRSAVLLQVSARFGQLLNEGEIIEFKIEEC